MEGRDWIHVLKRSLAAVGLWLEVCRGPASPASWHNSLKVSSPTPTHLASFLGGLHNGWVHQLSYSQGPMPPMHLWGLGTAYPHGREKGTANPFAGLA